MKRFLRLIVISISLGNFVFAQTSTVAAQNDGAIVENTVCPAVPKRAYEQYVEEVKKQTIETARLQNLKLDLSDFAAKVLGKEEYERRQSFSDYECQRIKYRSDGLKVVGFIWKPKNMAGVKLPLVIVNRGSNRETAKLTPTSFYYPFVTNGFAVIGSQYRGNEGGEGKEEYGGAEVNDILNLIPLARSLGYADMNNVFMFGESRGGMMTYLALKNKIPVNAAAVNAAPSDLVLGLKNRPVFAQMYKEMMPDYDKRADELIRERSAVYWADRINTPLLMLQGGADWRVEPIQTLNLAQKLQENGKTYELIVYAGDEHGLSLNRTDAERRIVEWFKKYMK